MRGDGVRKFVGEEVLDFELEEMQGTLDILPLRENLSLLGPLLKEHPLKLNIVEQK